MEFYLTPAKLEELAAPLRSAGSFAPPALTGIAALGEAAGTDLSFLGNPRYRKEVPASRAGVVLLPADYEGEPAEGQLYLFVDNPSLVLARVCAHIEKTLRPPPEPGIHPAAVVHPGASVDPAAAVGPGCVVEEEAVIEPEAVLVAQVFVGRGSRVGEGSWLAPQVTLMPHTILGRNVRLHTGVVLGSDGYGYETINGRHEKVPQIGRVVVEDEVEIGAATTIDRARFGETRIGEGTKIDNLVQIGHNVRLGKHCLIVSQVGLSGSVTVEDYVVIGGQVGSVGHITIGKGALIAAKAGVSKDVAPGAKIDGNPGYDFRERFRVEALTRKLPELFARVKDIEERLEGPGD